MIGSAADYAEICQLLYRYCAAHDARDVEALRHCFAADAELFGRRGREAVVERLAAGYVGITAQRRHVLTNIFIVEAREDEAIVQSYITLYLVRHGKVELHLTGVNRDRVVREEGAWKIRSREMLRDVEYDPGDRPASL